MVHAKMTMVYRMQAVLGIIFQELLPHTSSGVSVMAKLGFSFQSRYLSRIKYYDIRISIYFRYMSDFVPCGILNSINCERIG